MEINEIVTLVEKIPQLMEIQNRQNHEIRTLKEIISDLLKDIVLDSRGVQEYTGFNPVLVRQIMNKAGASRMHGKLWVRKSDLDNYLISNRRMSENEIELAAKRYINNHPLEELAK
jgi:hypothetical protein